jgi:hypothetical protein
MALPLSVTLVAFATELFRISRKHRLNCCNPGMQAQTVEAALELPKSSITKGGNASAPVASAVPWFTLLSSICFVMASISSLSVGDSQPQA